MRIVALDIVPAEPLPYPTTQRRLAPINETLWGVLRSTRAELPIGGRQGKVVLTLRPNERRPLRGPAVIGGNVELEALLGDELLSADRDAFRDGILRLVEESVAAAGARLGFNPDSLIRVVRGVRADQERIGLVELDWLRRRLRRDRADVRIFHRVTEVDSCTWLEVLWDDGRRAHREIRKHAQPEWNWVSFPGYSAKLSAASRYEVFRKDGRLLWSVDLDELRTLGLRQSPDLSSPSGSSDDLV